MTTAALNATNPLLIAAQWLGRIGNVEYHSGTGGAPCFAAPRQLDRYLADLATVITSDGSFNGESPHAERLAICLARSKNADDAIRLFQVIVRDEEQILFLRPQPSNYVSSAVADMPGKLGYEGMYRYGLLALAKGEKELAQKLFLEIVEKTPTECFPIRLQDVRVESLVHLKELGVKKLPSGRSVNDEYVVAERHQY